MKIVIELTTSQAMALTSVLVETMSSQHTTLRYIDCSTDPPTETEVGDLLTLITKATLKPRQRWGK